MPASRCTDVHTTRARRCHRWGVIRDLRKHRASRLQRLIRYQIGTCRAFPDLLITNAGPCVFLPVLCWLVGRRGRMAAAAESASTAEYNATPSAVDDLADQLAVEAGAPQDDVDESADLTGLREQDTDVVIDKTDKADPLYARTVSSFEDERLDLPAPLLKGLNEIRFVRPSKIQAASLPKIWAGRNLLAQSHNGTGKTACFVLGMLKVVSEEKTPQALCICPTRELAQQIATEVLISHGSSTLTP